MNIAGAPRLAGNIEDYLGTYTFPSVETVRAAKSTVSAISAKGDNYHHLHTSRAAYMILVRSLDKEEVLAFRRSVLGKFARYNVMLMTGKAKCYIIEDRKLRFVSFEQQQRALE